MEFVEKEILGQEELKKYLRIGSATLDDWRIRGLKAYRPNDKKIFYLMDDVKEFLRKYEV